MNRVYEVGVPALAYVASLAAVGLSIATIAFPHLSGHLPEALKGPKYSRLSFV